ncbi:MAG: 4Fe-4S ferredoxin iron-sulfur binding protein [uncultured bacterium]|nr:MAG: 4Fe-4S ferredoxin iron-sulfur binding protein [uncultured bacterium]
MLKVNKEKCPQNHSCPSVKICPTGAITQNGYELPLINSDKCIMCRKCIDFCPMRAIQEIN